MAAMRRLLCIAALVVVLCASHAQALHGSGSFAALQKTFLQLTTFGFYKGGIMNVSAAYTSSSGGGVTLSVCSSGRLDSIVSSHGSIQSLCNFNFSSACEWAAELNADNPVVSFNGVARTSDYYDYVYINCGTTEVDIQYAYRFVNPGDEHLSSGQIPFKAMTIVFACLWGAVFLFWSLNALMYSRTANPLFRTLGSVPLISAMQQAVAAYYWHRLSDTGNENLVALLSMLGLSAVSSTTLLAILVVIAKGWFITRRRLLDTEWRNIAVMSVIFLICYSTYEVFSGFFFLFLLILVYVLVLRYLFASVSTNIRVLLFQLRFLRASNPNVPEQSLLPARQLRATRVFRSALPVYIILDIMLHVWSLMALERSPWAEAMLINSCTLFVALFLWYVDRPRVNSRRSSLIACGGYNSIVFRLQASSVYFQDATQQPLMLSARPDPVPVVIVRNPDTLDSSGRKVPSVVVGVPTEHDSCTAAGFNTDAMNAAASAAAASTFSPPEPRSAPSDDAELGGRGSMLNVDAGALAPLIGTGRR